MKAYQIKIAVKKISPPVWRRCIIPSGITFAQLSVILNEITGWDKECYYEFEFYQRKQQLRENHDDSLFKPSWQYDLLEASETYIDEFMEQEEWFSYLKRDELKYRVTIEKTLDRDEAYPCILKYKGECPGAMSVEPLDKTNAELKKKFSVTYGESRFQQQWELYEMLGRGEYGLYGSRNPVNDEGKIHRSADPKLKSIAELFADKFMNAASKHVDGQGNVQPSDELEKEWNNIYSEYRDHLEKTIREQIYGKSAEIIPKRRGIRVKDALECYPKTDLLHYAKELGIRRVSGLNKAELAEKIANEILSPSVMKKRMSMLSDAEIQLFEKLLDCVNLYEPTEEEDEVLQTLYCWDYVVTDYRDRIEVPVDVENVYKKISTLAFHENRKKMVWMKKCLEVLVSLYVVAPVKIFRRLYRRHPDFKVDTEELVRIFHMLPDEENPCALVGDKIVHKEALNDDLYLKIEELQEGKDFYIPSLREIEDYAEHRYFSEEKSYQKLGEFLMSVLKVDPERTDYMLFEIFQKIDMDDKLQDILDDFKKKGIVFPDDKAFFDFCRIMSEVNNNTRMFINRGHKPLEICGRTGIKGGMPTIVPGSTNAAKLLNGSQAQLEEMGINVDFDPNAREIPAAVLSNGTVRTGTRKIYPNDPCPCGSGKKYKKCCGRL